MEQQVQMVPWGQLIVDEKNPHVYTEAELKRLAKSLIDFPKMLRLRPIIVDRKWKILGGTKRYLAAELAGFKEVPVVVASNLTSAEKKMFVVKDNIHYGQFSEELLAAYDPELIEDAGFKPVGTVGGDQVKTTRVTGNRQLTFRYSAAEYEKVERALQEAMTEDKYTNREDYLKYLLGC